MRLVVLLAAISGLAVEKTNGDSCAKLDTLNRSLRDSYCDQPLFLNFITRSDLVEMYDNICLTFFPLPDDPSTFQIYASIVYCDGSYEVFSTIATDISRGVVRAANPFFTYTVSVVGYAGCDTYIIHACNNFPGSSMHLIVGSSPNCQPMGLSCLRKVQDILADKCLQDDGDEFYVLPMKLPNKCVTQQNCLNPVNNDFYKALGLAGPVII